VNDLFQVWKNIFFEELSVCQIREILLDKKEQSEVFKAIYIFFLCTTSFLFF